jgi:hypothetical protein
LQLIVIFEMDLSAERSNGNGELTATHRNGLIRTQFHCFVVLAGALSLWLAISLAYAP